MRALKTNGETKWGYQLFGLLPLLPPLISRKFPVELAATRWLTRIGPGMAPSSRTTVVLSAVVFPGGP